MPSYSKGHERDENRKMNQAFTHSVIGLLLCWLPVVGFLLAASGFLRMMARITQTHRAKRIVFTVFTLIVLLGSIGVLGWEIFEYSRNPDIISDGTHLLWEAMTGDETFPWETDPVDDTDFNDYSDYGFDPYADTGSDFDDSYDTDAGYDYDADFDDSELDGFPEDDTDDLPEKDLFNQMLSDEKTAGKMPLP